MDLRRRFGGCSEPYQNRIGGFPLVAVYSGWWLGGRAQWEEYNRGGIRTPETEEGDAWGAALSGGYSLMLHQNINLDLGIGLWGGYKRYTVYRCPTCGKVQEQGSKVFVMPSDLMVSLMFTF